jgi:hypothetical protein
MWATSAIFENSPNLVTLVKRPKETAVFHWLQGAFEKVRSH